MLLLILLAGVLAGEAIVWCADRLPAGRPLFWRAPEGWAVSLGWQAAGRLRPRSLAIIVVAAAGAAFLWLRYGATWDMLAYSVYWLFFLLIAVTDLEHRYIYNVVMLPAIVIAAAGALLTTTPGLRRALLGGATGFIFIFLIYLLGIVFGKVVARRRGRPLDEVAFGQGDVKLAAFIGLVTGLPGVIFALVIGILLGGIVASGVLLWQMFVRRRYAAFTAIPYGPFLIAGGLLMMVYGPQIVAWYVGMYAP